MLDELGLHDLPMIAIAKGKMRNSGDETFFDPGLFHHLIERSALVIMMIGMMGMMTKIDSPPDPEVCLDPDREAECCCVVLHGGR